MQNRFETNLSDFDKKRTNKNKITSSDNILDIISRWISVSAKNSEEESSDNLHFNLILIHSQKKRKIKIKKLAEMEIIVRVKSRDCWKQVYQEDFEEQEATSFKASECSEKRRWRKRKSSVNLYIVRVFFSPSVR